jgi:hypothetical protein
VYNVKAAVRRLPFAPAPEAMKVTDVQQGRFVFAPAGKKEVSLAALEKAVVRAGYEIEGVRIEVRGALVAGDRLRDPVSGQVFALLPDKEAGAALAGLREKAPGTVVAVSGRWRKGEGKEPEGIEVTAWRPAP